MLDRRPPRLAFLGLLMLAVLPPFVARGFGTGLGAFAMFTRIERYHLDLFCRRAKGVALGVRSDLPEERVELESLASHLSPDAQQVILPAAGYGFGQEQLEELAKGLPDLGRLVCELRPGADSSRVVLSRSPFRGRVMTTSEVQVPCRPHSLSALVR